MTAAAQRLRRWARVLVAAAAVCAALLGAGPAGSGGVVAPAQAHAALVSSDPVEGAVLAKAPATAVLTFNESVTQPGKGVRVFDANGDAVPAAAVARDARVTVTWDQPLTTGTFVVTWRLISTDGHPITGSLTFSVGAPSRSVAAPTPAPEAPGSVTALLSIVQGVTYLALFLTAGLALFLGFAIPARLTVSRARRRVVRLVSVAGATTLAAAAVTIVVTTGHQEGRDLAATLSLRDASRPTTAELADFVVLAAGLFLILRNVTVAGSRGARLAISLGVLLLAGSLAMTGHSRGSSPAWLVITTDVLHVLAGSIWVGGLVGLAVTLPVMARRGRDCAQVLVRFSAAASLVLLALVASGSLLAWRIVSSWHALVSTGYGQLLLAKIALVVLALAFACWNRFALLPRTLSDDPAGATRSLVRTVTVEAICLTAALLVTGVLVNRSPDPAAAVTAGPVRPQPAALGGLTLTVTPSPGIVGRNELVLELVDTAGKPARTRWVPELNLSSADVHLGVVPVKRSGPGAYRAVVVLPASGTWRAQVSLRISQFENPVSTVTFGVRPAASSYAPRESTPSRGAQ